MHWFVDKEFALLRALEYFLRLKSDSLGNAVTEYAKGYPDTDARGLRYVVLKRVSRSRFNRHTRLG